MPKLLLIASLVSTDHHKTTQPPMNSPFEAVDGSPLPDLIGNSPAMIEAYRMTRLAAKSQASVLLLGETGTGKELFASALHNLSDRASGPFVRVNCGALTESLLASELFGHVKGSFTDAVKDRTGRFEAAHGGTIFLDEINSTSSTLQVKLLRVLQEREFERVGDSKSVSVDVRVIAASNCDLAKTVAEGKFREDLLWRLNVLPINLPPLRKRSGDVERLAQHFLDVYNTKNNGNVKTIAPAALEAMKKYNWPGNVRELQNYIERAVVLAQGSELESYLLPTAITGDRADAQAAVFRPTDEISLVREFVYNRVSKAEDSVDDLYKQIVAPVERELLEQVMESCNQTQTKAAQMLGINRNTLHKKLQESGLAKSKTEVK